MRYPAVNECSAPWALGHAVPLRAALRRGVTIVELLIAMTISLIVVYALLREFTQLIAQVADGRASVEIAGQMRGTTSALQNDLQGLTVPVRPLPSPAWAQGYFEIIEGPLFDGSWILQNANDLSFGDFDDVIACTVQSQGAPFVGQYVDFSTGNVRIADSHYAEVAWWAVWNDTDQDGQPRAGEVALYRRALLIRPDLGMIWQGTYSSSSLGQLWFDLKAVYDSCDISMYPIVTSSGSNVTVQLWANSLADLTKREHRFCHHPILARTGTNVSNYNYVLMTPNGSAPYRTNYPFEMARTALDTDNDGIPDLSYLPALNTVVQSGDQQGEDVIQTNILAFDVRVYDDLAPLVVTQDAGGNRISDVFAPGDLGYGVFTSPATQTVVGFGAYVDLFCNRYLPTAITSRFSGNWDARSQLNAPTYDTWSFHYEQDGIDQDAWMASSFAWRAGADQGTNGIDDNNTDGVDDPAERETSPPYPIPLRGIKVSIRVTEPDSRHVRQASVVQDFTAE